ncbi:MAG TPA: helix-turn-helix domain-containing protein [Acidimicrobiales bacterium]|nr:helix-turn-helix domain-containing protein [Acidimicrobiales bacterium]
MTTVVKPALAAGRAVEILDFFAAHPTEAFTLSELSKSLDINLASALSVLQALTDAGYLSRHPRRKTYALGPSLVALGSAALTRHRVVDLARGEMRVLARQLSTEVVASIAIGDHITVLATQARPGRRSDSPRVGQRLPLIPPIGQAFMAWGPASAVAAWRSRLGAVAWRDHLDRALEVVRARGYSVSVDSETRVRLGEAVKQLADRPKDRALQDAIAELVTELAGNYELLDIDDQQTYAVSTIVAPVFGPSGEVVLGLTLNISGPLRGDQVVDHADRLTQVTQALTTATGGFAA